MAYELFEELSTCNLEEIEKEDLEKIIEDCQRVLSRRKDTECQEAIAKFKESLTELEELEVRVFYDCSDYDSYDDDLTRVPIYNCYNLTFDY